ncbi:MAG: FAD-dependent oxidoreductase [Balneolaceae bacterium]|nr:FAD-dependent oxidoreductase [Balneolaceae bacterium]
MVIGIIGAGLSGLTAGRILARAGHEVTVFEKSRGYGGRMATRYAGKENSSKMDHGLSYFGVKSNEFREFTAELLDQGLIQTWGDNFAAYDGEKFLESAPNQSSEALYTSTGGMNKIGKYLARWVDIRTETKVGGLTYFGTNRSKKRSWMMNLTSSNTFEADAVIIALPAPQAYGIISSTIDETNTLKIVRQIDEVSYQPAFSLMAGYGSEEAPDWEGVICRNSPLEFISNESLKRDTQETSFVLQTSGGFTKEYRDSDEDTISKKMLGEFAEIAGGWAASPEWQQLHFWRYSRAQKVINSPYLELEDEDAPLALTGDYLNGNTVDDSYRSGYMLANDWVKKF